MLKKSLATNRLFKGNLLSNADLLSSSSVIYSSLLSHSYIILLLLLLLAMAHLNGDIRLLAGLVDDGDASGEGVVKNLNAVLPPQLLRIQRGTIDGVVAKLSRS